MNTLSANGFQVYFDAGEHEAAVLIRDACEKSAGLIRRSWNLATPADLRVYVLTRRWLRSTLHSAPSGRRILLWATLPLWYGRARRTWQIAGGWHHRHGRRHVVAVKPPHLLSAGDSTIGDRVFIRDDEPAARAGRIACHELVHAFTAHLALPSWLHEGLAMLTVDRFAGRPTVKRETVVALRLPGPDGAARRLDPRDPEALVRHYIRAYWLTRYLDETRPGLLAGLLATRLDRAELERRIADAHGMARDAFWRDVEGTVAAHYA